jgi:hypothetical protein
MIYPYSSLFYNRSTLDSTHERFLPRFYALYVILIYLLSRDLISDYYDPLRIINIFINEVPSLLLRLFFENIEETVFKPP